MSLIMGTHSDPSSRLKVAIVEDDDDIRAHLVQLFSNAEDFELLGAHGSAEEALDRLPRNPPQAVLMDINLPGINGIQCLRQLKAQLPSIQILMLTIYEDSERIFEALVAGASGYLLKRTPGAQLLEAVRDVLQGGSPMSSLIARKVVQHFNHQSKGSQEMQTLSERETEVLDQLARGRLYKEIASHLGISMDTVRKHLQNIYSKLHVHSRTEAVVKYLQK
jgi:DNA-binding NarL/FixJ family response regulator